MATPAWLYEGPLRVGAFNLLDICGLSILTNAFGWFLGCYPSYACLFFQPPLARLVGGWISSTEVEAERFNYLAASLTSVEFDENCHESIN